MVLVCMYNGKLRIKHDFYIKKLERMVYKVSSREEVWRRYSGAVNKKGKTHCWVFHSIHSIFYNGIVVGFCIF